MNFPFSQCTQGKKLPAADSAAGSAKHYSAFGGWAKVLRHSPISLCGVIVANTLEMDIIQNIIEGEINAVFCA